MKSSDEELMNRTIKIIEARGRILLKEIGSPWYLGQWTNIPAGPDAIHWGKRNTAMEIFNLKWAFVLARLYNCKVVAVYPKKDVNAEILRISRECIDRHAAKNEAVPIQDVHRVADAFNKIIKKIPRNKSNKKVKP